MENGNGHTKHLPEEWQVHLRAPIPDLPFRPSMSERYHQEVLVKRGHLAGATSGVALLAIVNAAPAFAGEGVSLGAAIATTTAFVAGATFMILIRYTFGRSG